MFGGTQDELGLQLFRITVLGSANSGKTSLISSFVNNFCPTVYTPTSILDSLLYYKTVDLVEVRCQQISGEEHSLSEHSSGADSLCMLCGKEIQSKERFWRCKQKVSCGIMCSKCWLEQHEEQRMPVLVEIEDSFGREVMEGDKYETMFLTDGGKNHRRGSSDFPQDPETPWSRQNSPASPKSVKGSQRSSQLSPAAQTPNRSSTMRLSTNDFKAPSSPSPLISSAGAEEKSSPFITEFNSQEESQPQAQLLRRFNPPTAGMHAPLAKRRMGYLIVYDCQDEQSFEEALELFNRLLLTSKSSKKQPVVFLVANKLDTASVALTKRLRTLAKQYIDQAASQLRSQAASGQDVRCIRFEEVSATELRKVRSLFRRMLLAMKDNPSLWSTEKKEESIFGAFNPFADTSNTARSSDDSSRRRSSRSGESAESAGQMSPRSASSSSDSETEKPVANKEKEKCTMQ